MNDDQRTLLRFPCCCWLNQCRGIAHQKGAFAELSLIGGGVRCYFFDPADLASGLPA
jgi:hypothetical protein